MTVPFYPGLLPAVKEEETIAGDNDLDLQTFNERYNLLMSNDASDEDNVVTAVASAERARFPTEYVTDSHFDFNSSSDATMVTSSTNMSPSITAIPLDPRRAPTAYLAAAFEAICRVCSTPSFTETKC